MGELLSYPGGFSLRELADRVAGDPSIIDPFFRQQDASLLGSLEQILGVYGFTSIEGAEETHEFLGYRGLPMLDGRRMSIGIAAARLNELGLLDFYITPGAKPITGEDVPERRFTILAQQLPWAIGVGMALAVIRNYEELTRNEELASVLVEVTAVGQFNLGSKHYYLNSNHVEELNRS